VALSLAATELLLAAGLDDVTARATALAQRFADALAAGGRTVGPRGDTTLVAWEDPDPAETRLRLAEAGVAVRNLPGTPYLRASVGAWNDESDLERLLAAL
jgi:L-cysteine/cystine lyase